MLSRSLLASSTTTISLKRLVPLRQADNAVEPANPLTAFQTAFQIRSWRISRLCSLTSALQRLQEHTDAVRERRKTQSSAKGCFQKGSSFTPESRRIACGGYSGSV